MRKYLAVLILTLVVFIIPSVVFATEGTCSWHAGVDCYSGPDWDGSAVCNDGWRDSSEYYFSNENCREIHFCTALEYEIQKSNYSDYDARVQKANNILEQINQLYLKKLSIPIEIHENSLGRGITTRSIENQIEQALRTNENEITKLRLELYPIESKLQKDIDTINTQCISIGEDRYNTKMEKQQEERLNMIKTVIEEQNKIYSQIQSQTQYSQKSPSQTSSCPSNSYYLNGQCHCNDGYNFFNNICMTYTTQCILMNNGEEKMVGSKLDAGTKINCECVSGYSWDGKKCVIYTTPTVTQKFESEKPEVTPTQNVVSEKKEDILKQENKIGIKNEIPKNIKTEISTTTATTSPKEVIPRISFFKKITSWFKNWFK